MMIEVNVNHNIANGNLEFAIGCSDHILVGISVVGLAILAYTAHSILKLTRSKSEADDDHLTEEERLCRADVSALTRAQRRARAKAIMKEQRRLQHPSDDRNPDDAAARDANMDPADADAVAVADVVDDEHNEIINGTAQVTNRVPALSRKERQLGAKVVEREERRLFQHDRERQQKEAQIVAQQLKKERLVAATQRMEQERQQKELETEARIQQQQRMRRIFMLASGTAREKSVSEFVADCRNDRVVMVDAIAKLYGVEPIRVTDRIQQLLSEGRIAGIFQKKHQRFIYVADEELRLIASTVRERGSVSRKEFTTICEQMIGL
jgi:DDRGK domain